MYNGHARQSSYGEGRHGLQNYSDLSKIMIEQLKHLFNTNHILFYSLLIIGYIIYYKVVIMITKWWDDNHKKER